MSKAKRERHRAKIEKRRNEFKPDEREVSSLETKVRLFQPIVLLFLLIRFFFFRIGNEHYWWEEVLFWGGGAFAVFSQLRIFIPTRFGARRLLITGDIFKYTSHPMYTGIVIADSSLWRGNLHSLLFWYTLFLLYGGVILFGRLHEKEMVSKFGQAAKEYYARTPRLFFLYPFLKR